MGRAWFYVYGDDSGVGNVLSGLAKGRLSQGAAATASYAATKAAETIAREL